MNVSSGSTIHWGLVRCGPLWEQKAVLTDFSWSVGPQALVMHRDRAQEQAFAIVRFSFLGLLKVQPQNYVFHGLYYFTLYHQCLKRNFSLPENSSYPSLHEIIGSGSEFSRLFPTPRLRPHGTVVSICIHSVALTHAEPHTSQVSSLEAELTLGLLRRTKSFLSCRDQHQRPPGCPF